jgi:glycerol-3-phosphate dehydrogenase (NAD(P)+)
LVTLIGPSFANEVFKNEPTVLNAVSQRLILAKRVSKLFNNHHFKCIEILDEIGAEMMGASKNVMAIAMGVTYELHTSINTRAALLAQVTKEISRIVKVYGGEVETVLQFCGIGDIYLTCTDDKSRNFSFGKNIARVGVKRALANNNKTIEGYESTRVLYNIIKSHHIQAPALTEIYQVLFNNKNPKFFVRNVIKQIIE